jgi:hypothetical protein
MLSRENIKLTITVIAIVGAALAIAKEAYKVPPPLLMFIGGMFVICSTIFWIWRRQRQTSALMQLGQWLLLWSTFTAASLLGVYHFDKAGWLWFKLSGYNITLAENLADRIHLPAAVFVKRYPFFSLTARDSTKLFLAAGKHNIDETIIVPSGVSLTIAPGAVLQFRVGCSLISYSPIVARGTAEAPIIFTARNRWQKWGVAGVVRADSSIFEHVRFEHGRQALINGVNMPGTLSLIETDAEVSQSQFCDLFGKDGAYVNGGQVFFRDNLFRNTFKDGVDFDGGAGEISRNRFENCGDEGIDRDETTQVKIDDNVIVGSKDAPKAEKKS